MARTTQKMTSRVRRQRRESKQPVSSRACRTCCGPITCSKQEQAVQDPSRLAGRQQTQVLVHLRHSLPDTCVRDKHKVSGGCDLRLRQTVLPLTQEVRNEQGHSSILPWIAKPSQGRKYPGHGRGASIMIGRHDDA